MMGTAAPLSLPSLFLVHPSLLYASTPKPDPLMIHLTLPSMRRHHGSVLSYQLTSITWTTWSRSKVQIVAICIQDFFGVDKSVYFHAPYNWYSIQHGKTKVWRDGCIGSKAATDASAVPRTHSNGGGGGIEGEVSFRLRKNLCSHICHGPDFFHHRESHLNLAQRSIRWS